MEEKRRANIVEALRVLMEAYLLHKAKQASERSDEHDTFRVFSMADIMALPPEFDMVDNPIRMSLKLGMKHLGEVLNSEGGRELMEAVCCEVCEMPEFNNSGWPVYVLDKTWDGIGSWVA